MMFACGMRNYIKNCIRCRSVVLMDVTDIPNKKVNLRSDVLGFLIFDIVEGDFDLAISAQFNR